MNVVIVGGNECMSCRYRELCESYGCKAKVYTKLRKDMKNIGSPDLLILFTGTMSHKMLQSVISEVKGRDIAIERCHTSSMAALKGIMNSYKERMPAVV